MCILDSLSSGVFSGLIATILFIILQRIVNRITFNKQYKHLASRDKGEFDWIGYSMRPENGRIKGNRNGATANVSLKENKVFIRLRHNNREWEGELLMERFGFGVVTVKYKDAHEYGKRECVIGSYTENGLTVDYLFLYPVDPQIYYLRQNENGDYLPVYHYGTELLERQRASA